MKKFFDFFKSNFIAIKWTGWYFFTLWLILKYIFNFDMFSCHYWWKFFHATLHGFPGFVFGLLIYTAIPIYIVTTIITIRKKEYVIKISIIDKIFAFVSNIISKIFSTKQKTETKTETKTENDIKPEESKKNEYPADLPPELRIPFMRAKNNLSLNGQMSVYNQNNTQIKQQIQQTQQQNESVENAIPVPTDFDIDDTFNESQFSSIPTFTDLNFDVPSDTPIATEKELENNTTKYLTQHGIEFETYKNMIATQKYLIYEHNDDDFWVMDGDSWFASGKQIDSPVNELKQIAKQNEIIPVIYLHSKNIMDIDNTIANFESNGIHVVKSLEELD